MLSITDIEYKFIILGTMLWLTGLLGGRSGMCDTLYQYGFLIICITIITNILITFKRRI